MAGNFQKRSYLPNKEGCDRDCGILASGITRRCHVLCTIHKESSILSCCWTIMHFTAKIQIIDILVTFAVGATRVPVTLTFNKDGQETTRHHNQEKVKRCLHAKDRALLSDSGYHELKMVPGSGLPPLTQIVKERRRQSNEIPLNCSSEGDRCQRKISDILKYLLDIEEFANLFTDQNTTMRLRFAGDGRKTSKKIGSVMAVFSVVKEGHPSSDYQYTTCLYNGKEGYDKLQKHLGNVFQEMKDLEDNGLMYKGRLYKIEWLICSDWKFLALIMGLSGPTAQYFCIWCWCTKHQIIDFTVDDWPISRSHDLITELLAKKGEERCGHSEMPLVHIPFDRIVVDSLHLFLRIMGKLFNQVISWTIEQGRESTLEEEMKKIGLSFNFYEVRGDDGKSRVTWTALDGKDLNTVLSKLPLNCVLHNRRSKAITAVDTLSKAALTRMCQERGLRTSGTKQDLKCRIHDWMEQTGMSLTDEVNQVQPDLLNVDQLQKLWADFKILMEALQANPGDREYKNPHDFHAAAKQWAKDFRRITFDEDVTPYIHALVYHVHQFLEKYEVIHNLNCQAVENKNHQQSKAFHRGSQKGGRGKSYVKQVMERENRLMFARKYGLERKKRCYKKTVHVHHDSESSSDTGGSDSDSDDDEAIDTEENINDEENLQSSRIYESEEEE